MSKQVTARDAVVRTLTLSAPQTGEHTGELVAWVIGHDGQRWFFINRTEDVKLARRQVTDAIGRQFTVEHDDFLTAADLRDFELEIGD